MSSARTAVEALSFSTEKKEFILNDLDPILEKMVAEVIAKAPARPMDFMIAWLRRSANIDESIPSKHCSLQQTNANLRKQLAHMQNFLQEVGAPAEDAGPKEQPSQEPKIGEETVGEETQEDCPRRSDAVQTAGQHCGGEETQKRCGLMLTRIQKETEANRGLAKAREAAEEISRKLAEQALMRGKMRHILLLLACLSQDMQKRVQIEADLREKDAARYLRQVRVRIVEVSKVEYYDRLFGGLEEGEILEWYNTDLAGWEDLGSVFGNITRQRALRRILDLGCGTSRLPVQLARLDFGPRVVVGCDASAVAIARQRVMVQPRRPGQARLIFTVAEASRLPFRDSCFDIIIEKGFLDALLSTRLGEQQVPAVLKEAWRALAAGRATTSGRSSRGCQKPCPWLELL
ncbi:eef1aknmt [Symbiodinium natans]|uniref:Eef1aknmt protein n=1 Tax=Symbiodinium natans TaxID=878477 RepID=A0A812QII5_9DINO|nr:eef1aknmt [Symbiodinium natans]